MEQKKKVENNSIKRAMPCNIEAEQSLLGSILLDNSIALEVVSNVKENDFYSEAHRMIFNAINELVRGGRPIDIVTVCDQLEMDSCLVDVGGLAYVSQIAECVPSSMNYLTYQNILKRDALSRNIIQASQNIINNTFESGSSNEALSFAEKSIFDISNTVDNSSLVNLKDSFSDVLMKFSTIQTDKNAFRGLMTGFTDLDKVTNGLQKSDLILLAARPGVGKTSFSTNIVEYVSVYKGFSSAVFSLEMPRIQLAQRMICSVANISMAKALKGELNQQEWESLWKANQLVSEAKIYVDDSSLTTPRQILSKCRRLKMAKGLDLVMIDYIQLMGGDNKKYDNRQSEISDISRNLKIMAKELNVPVIALSQLSRAAEQATRPMLSHLRESGAIEQDADIVMFIHRPDKVEANLEKVEKNEIPKDVAEIIIAKHRNGALDSVNLKWHGEMTKFVNIGNRAVDEIAKAYNIDESDRVVPEDIIKAPKEVKEGNFEVENSYDIGEFSPLTELEAPPLDYMNEYIPSEKDELFD